MEDNRTCPDVMTNPELLADNDSWDRPCPLCTVTAQGGLEGLISHYRVCHPGRRLPR